MAGKSAASQAEGAELTPSGSSSGVNERRLLLTIGLSILTGPWNFTMLIVALPILADDLNVTLVTASWIIVIPMVASSSLQSIMGRLGDVVGYRRVLIFALIGYTVMTTIAIFAANFWFLVAARTLQVMFGSASFPNASALIRVNLPESRRASAYGIIGSAISIAITGGPFVGGALSDAFGWQAIFVANLPLSIAAAVLMFTQVPADRQTDRRRPKKLDIVGALLLLLTISSIVMPLAMAQDGLIRTSLLPFMYAGSLLITASFAFWEYRHSEPVIQVRLYLVRSFRSAAVSEMFMNFSGFPLTVVASVYLQALQGRSASSAGLVIALGTVGMAVMSPIGGRLADRLGRRTPIIIGRVVMLCGLVILVTTVSATTNPFIIALGMGLVFSGNGLALPPGQTAAIESAPREFSGMAAGVATTTAFLGGIMGVTWSSIYLGENPSVSNFEIVFLAFITASCLSILIASRIHPWPASEQREREESATA